MKEIIFGVRPSSISTASVMARPGTRNICPNPAIVTDSEKFDHLHTSRIVRRFVLHYIYLYKSHNGSCQHDAGRRVASLYLEL